jgi:hypothetical protein
MMEAFSIAAALTTAVQGRALIVLHLLPTGHNPVRDAVSDYGVGPLFDVATLWDGYGAARLLHFAAALARSAIDV